MWNGESQRDKNLKNQASLLQVCGKDERDPSQIKLVSGIIIIS